MRLLLIDVVTAPDVLQTRAALIAAGHHVELIAPGDPDRLRRALEGSWDVVLMDWLDTPSPREIMALATGAREGEAPACIICSTKATPANIDAAFRCGVEDFLRKPFSFEQLRGRLGRLLAHHEALAEAAARGDRRSQEEAAVVLDLDAWQNFPELAAQAIAGVTMLPLILSGAGPGLPSWLAATMNLSVPTSHLECRAVVDGDRDSLEKLALASIGSSDAAAAADLLNEIVNTAGGAFMRCALDEELIVTSGLPMALSPSEASRAIDNAAHRTACWVIDPASGARLRVRMGVRLLKNRFVKVLSLREGMVLAKDLRSPDGAVLLTAGTRVTSSTSDRIRHILDVNRLVEVADTAA